MLAGAVSTVVFNVLAAATVLLLDANLALFTTPFLAVIATIALISAGVGLLVRRRG